MGLPVALCLSSFVALVLPVDGFDAGSQGAETRGVLTLESPGSPSVSMAGRTRGP